MAIKRRNFTTEQKVELMRQYKAAGATFGGMSKWMKEHHFTSSTLDRWKKDPEIQALLKKPAGIQKMEVITIPKAEEFVKDLSGDNVVGFDDSEHRLIKLACMNMRESLDAILYKLQIMDVPEKKK